MDGWTDGHTTTVLIYYINFYIAHFLNNGWDSPLLGLYDAIILDVDSKDVSTGVSSPPRAFVDEQFLTDTRLLLKESGKLTCLYQFSIPLDLPLPNPTIIIIIIIVSL